MTITIFVLGGAWLDRRYPSLDPLFTLLGAGLGIVGATATLVYGVLDQTRKEAKRK